MIQALISAPDCAQLASSHRQMMKTTAACFLKAVHYYHTINLSITLADSLPSHLWHSQPSMSVMHHTCDFDAQLGGSRYVQLVEQGVSLGAGIDAHMPPRLVRHRKGRGRVITAWSQQACSWRCHAADINAPLFFTCSTRIADHQTTIPSSSFFCKRCC